MPNWCINMLAVSGPKADVRRFREQAKGYEPWHHMREQDENVLNFHSLVPVPPEILSAGYEASGYDWERIHWGCKWGACHSELVDEWEGHLAYTFDTAWSPPVAFLARLAPQWPTLLFLLDYEEMGLGLKGIAKARGLVVEDHRLAL